jgi:hypothetical protein
MIGVQSKKNDWCDIRVEQIENNFHPSLRLHTSHKSHLSGQAHPNLLHQTARGPKNKVLEIISTECPSFLHSFSMKEKLIGVIDGMTQKEILSYSKGKKYQCTK